MNWIASMWPFDHGQQHLILSLTGVSIIGLIVLNVFSALRQRMPMQRILSGLFTQVPTNNRIEKALRLMLFVWLVLGFVILVLDTQINGMQLVDPEWASKR